MEGSRRAPPVIRGPTECPHSLRTCRTTRLLPSSPISVPRGAIAEPQCPRARPTSCAPHLWIESVMLNSDPTTDDTGDTASQDVAVNAIVRSGPGGAVVLAG